jgi:hypothetical protein
LHVLIVAAIETQRRTATIIVFIRTPLDTVIAATLTAMFAMCEVHRVIFAANIAFLSHHTSPIGLISPFINHPINSRNNLAAGWFAGGSDARRNAAVTT